MTSRDGYQWTEAAKLQAGVPSIGVIEPETNVRSADDIDYDVVVVGSGYCGLTASRDAAISGLRVLLLEARDRIGGRSWSSDIGGYPFEMGGTWVHWGQPNVWAQISRYNMREELEISYDFTAGLNKYLLTTTEGTQAMTHEEEDALMDSGLRKLMNIDGAVGKVIMPFPHNALYNPEAIKYDTISVADRLEEIKNSLTPNERCGIEAFVLLCSGGTLETTSFFEFLHWWALCGHCYEGCIELLVKYKFRRGQSSFAIRFFQEALSTGNLSYAFNTPIARVKDRADCVEVTSRDGRRFRAARMICAVPLQILQDVSFDPPLAPGKLAASKTGHVNQCIKVHAEIDNKDLRSWTGIAYPHNKLIYGFGDGTTPAGNTHVVCFGAQHNHFEPEDDIQQTIKALKGFADMSINRVVFHNWSKDEFAKGAWFFSAPNFLSQYLDALRSRQGNLFFANSDWALGWRSFIDGAIEEGTRAAFEVRADLRGKVEGAEPRLSKL